MNVDAHTTTDASAEAPHVQGYGLFIKVWAVLIVLTLVLVGMSLTPYPNLAVLGLLLITPTKAGLVLFYFMHLKYESPTLKYMAAAALAVLIIFIGLTYSDYLYR